MYRKSLQVLGLALISALGFYPAIQAVEANKIAPVVAFPDVGIAISQPSGFKKAKTFHGFQQPSTGSSVVLLAIPGPYLKVIAGFDQDALAAKGMSLRSKKKVKVKGQTALLLNLSQRAYGQEFLKWVIIFGDQHRTQMVMATFPKSHVQELSAPLQKILLSVSPEKTASSSVKLPFSIQTEQGFALVEGISIGNTALFTKDGTIPTTAPEDPLFVVALSFGKVFVGNQQEFAERRLLNTADINVETLQSTTPIVVDDTSGFEMIAIGKDRKTQTPLRIYQVMLFPKQGGYILMTGAVGEQQVDSYLPKFQSMAKTFRKLPK